MQAAIETLTALRGKNRGFAIVGDMLELGEHSAPMHRMIGSMAAGSNIAGIYVTGNFADDVAAGALEGQMDSKNIFKGSREEILQAITKKLDAGDWILVKGSRGMTMETVVDGLLKWAGDR
jgi:UDP-N-acetylmuramoyl-tripeptide--D-alanyl-D-alanine ligase